MSEYYCYRQSWGFQTNLQLYSLLQAWRLWKEFEGKEKEFEGKEEELKKYKIREQCVVVISLLGLSLSQLLGQNVPTKKNYVPKPRELLRMAMDDSSVETKYKETIEAGFCEFMKDYNACRHFGEPKYETVTAITLKRTRKHVELSILIWDTICSQFGNDCGSIKDILDDLLAGFDYAPHEE